MEKRRRAWRGCRSSNGAAALETLEDCARTAIDRYNEDHNPTPVAGAPNTEVNRPNTERTDPKTAKPPRCEREGSGEVLKDYRPKIR